MGLAEFILAVNMQWIFPMFAAIRRTFLLSAQVHPRAGRFHAE